MTRKQQLLTICIGIFLCVLGTVTAVAQSPADQFSEAAGYYSRGEWDESIAAFEALIVNHPKTEQSYEAYFFLGESQLQKSNYPLAKIAYQKFLTYQPKSQFVERANFRLAEIAYRTDDLQATSLLETFIRENPESKLIEYAAAYLGEARLQRTEPQLAQHVFERVIAQFPESSLRPEYEIGLAKALQMQNRLGEARQLYSRLVVKNDDQIVKDSQFQLGLLEFSQSDWKAAIGHFLEVKKDAGDDKERLAEATYWIGRCHLELGDANEAVLHFEQLSPEAIVEKIGPAVYYDGAVAWAHDGQNEKALNWLAVIREKYSDSPWGDDALQLEIEIAQRSNRYEDVLKFATLFAERYPESPLLERVKESQGRVYYERQDYQRTIEVFNELLNQASNEAAQQNEKTATWKYFVGLGQIGLTQFALAADVLATIDSKVSDESFQAAVAIAHGTALSAIEEFEKAGDCYRTYLRLQPRGAEVARCLSELSISQVELKDWQGAADRFDQLVTQFPGEENVVATAAILASAAYQAEQLDYAARWYEVLIQPGVDKEMVGKGLTGLAWVYLKGGDNHLALKHFERILTEFPDTDFAIDAAMARAKQLEDARSYEEALKTYRLVTGKTSRVRLANIARLRIAFCCQKLGGAERLNDARLALVEYLQTPSDQDHVDEAIYQLGWVCLDLGLAEEGYQNFERLAQEHPESKYWADAAYRLAEARFKEKEYEQAQRLVNQLLAKAVQVEILSRSVYLNGQMAALNHEWAHVSKNMRALLDRCEDRGVYAKASYWLAESLYQQDEMAAAADLFGQLIEKKNLLDETMWPWVALRHAQCQAKIDGWQTVLTASQSAIESHPEFKRNYEHHYLLGRALEKQGRLVEAREMYLTVVSSTEGGRTETAAKAQWRIGETYFHQEDYKSAIQAFYKVDSLFTYPRWRAAAIYEAGKCQEHLGNWRHAVVLYEQLLTSFPECEFAADARKRLEFANRQASTASTNEIKR